MAKPMIPRRKRRAQTPRQKLAERYETLGRLVYVRLLPGNENATDLSMRIRELAAEIRQHYENLP